MSVETEMTESATNVARTNRFAARFNDLIERRAWVWAMTLVCLFLAAALADACRRPLWYDELNTYYVAIQPGPAAIVQATLDGCDTAPPLYAILAHPLLGVVSNQALALRLPSILGGAIMLFCVFALLRRRSSALYALAGMLATAIAFRAWALNARCYGLVFACTGLALLCWQNAAGNRGRRWALGLGLSLAAGIALQYYSVFLLVPLACGELVRWRQSKRMDYPIGAALAGAPLMLLLQLPLLRADARYIHGYYAQASWAEAVFAQLEFAMWTLVGLTLSLAAYQAWRYVAKTSGAVVPRPALPPVHEIIAWTVLALLPWIVVFVAMYTTHTFVDRYAAPALVCVNLLLIVLVWWTLRGSRMLGLSLLVVFLMIFCVRYGRPLLGSYPLINAEAAKHLLAAAPAEPRPILIPEHGVFLELWYHEPQLQPRLSYVFDAKAGGDGMVIPALSRRTNIRAADYEPFIAANPRFLLCAAAGGETAWDLMKRGFVLKPLTRADGFELYEVEQQAAQRPVVLASHWPVGHDGTEESVLPTKTQ